MLVKDCAQLVPCGICGESPNMLERPPDGTRIWGEGSSTLFNVECPRCGNKGESSESWDSAVGLWNGLNTEHVYTYPYG